MLKPRPPRPLISSTILGSRGNNLSSRRFLAAVPFSNVVWLLKVDTDDLDAMSGADRVLSPPLTFIFIEVLFRAALPGFEMKTHSDGRRWQNSTKSGFFISIAADDDDMHLIIMGLAFPLLKFRLQNFGRIEFQIVNEIHRDDGFTSKTFQSNKPNLSQMDGTTIKLQILSTAASGQKHIPQNLVESPKRIWITHTEKLTYRLIRKLSSTVVCTHSRLIFPKSLTPPNSLGCGIWQKGVSPFFFSFERWWCRRPWVKQLLKHLRSLCCKVVTPYQCDQIARVKCCPIAEKVAQRWLNDCASFRNVCLKFISSMKL